ncbi:thioesterase II family protein [Streptomyces sp. NPDC048111]|uniref:thioesterase II family protein n=1 Tax=Streptomyces sp. NPDC048111 TaxID=3365500 RepID=UPI00371CCA7D
MNGPRPRVEGDWLFVPAPQEYRPYRLFCFPHAGGDATAFTRLGHALAPAAEVWALRMPARGGRGRHPMPATFDQLVRSVVEALGPHLHGRFGFYGQSFGSLLAYEVARALPAGHRPDAVIAASASPPHEWGGTTAPRRDAEDLLRLAGMGELIASAPELREMALHAIRADLGVLGTYRHRGAPLLRGDLYALAGDADPMLDAGALAGWSRHTTGDFGLTVVRGGHLLATVEEPGPVDVLTSVIGRERARPGTADQWLPPRPVRPRRTSPQLPEFLPGGGSSRR